MKLIKIKKYYINLSNISYVEIGDKKCINLEEIGEFNKLFLAKVIELYGTNWMENLKLCIDTDCNFGIGFAYNYYEASSSNINYIKDKWFQKFRKLVIDKMDIPVPQNKFEYEYTIYFNGDNQITDFFTPDELYKLGVDKIDSESQETDDIIKTFLNFE